MPAIVSVNPDLAELEVDEDQRIEPARLTLILTDKADEQHRLVLEAPALRELAMLLRGIQERFPGLLGGH